MTKTDEYRANAAECQRMAGRARSEADKVQWLQLAQSWMMLLQDEQQNTALDPAGAGIVLLQNADRPE